MIDMAAQTAAARLTEAVALARPLDGLGDAMDPASPEAGYRVQAIGGSAREAAGAQRVGWKIGLTSAAVQQAFGAREPMRGRLYDDTALPAQAEVSLRDLCAPRLEGEIVLRVRDAPRADCSDADLLGSIASVHAAFEIADSRFVDWRFGIGEAIADNACCGRFAIVEPGVSPDAIDLPAVAMTIQDTASGEIVSMGVGANCLGSPLHAYRWLVQTAGAGAIRVGDLILTGALGPMVPLVAGRRYSVELRGLGGLSLTVRP